MPFLDVADASVRNVGEAVGAAVVEEMDEVLDDAEDGVGRCDVCAATSVKMS